MVPKTDTALAEYSTNFNARGSASPGDFNLSVEQMAQYSLLHDAYMASYFAAKAEGSRSSALVAGKDQNKAALLRWARELYHLIQVSPAVSNENKVLIGVKVPSASRSPIAPPELAPLMSVLSVVGRTVRCKLSDASAPSVRRRPINARGAIIMSYAGKTPPPAGTPGWKLEKHTGKPLFAVEFASTVGPETACWIAARWYNRRGQYSPASAPVQTYLQCGPAAPVVATRSAPEPMPARVAA